MGGSTSRLSKLLDEELDEFRKRLLGKMKYVYLDARYVDFVLVNCSHTAEGASLHKTERNDYHECEKNFLDIWDLAKK